MSEIPEPKHPWIQPGELLRELDDLHDMAAEVGLVGPLRDVMAHLLTVREVSRGVAVGMLGTVAP